MKRFTYFLFAAFLLNVVSVVFAEDVIINRGRDRNTSFEVSTGQYMQPAGKTTEEGQASDVQFDPVNYTLGPNDVVEIEVMRHPEFSGKYPIDQEGKLQYKYVGDLNVKGLSKKELEKKLSDALSQFVVSPEVNITIVQFGSKVFYVIGEVAAPGRFTMRSEEISLREAIHMAGLPTQNAAMRRCRIITPSEKGKSKVRKVDLFSLLYYGDLRKDVTIKSGDILYVPATLIAKAIREISPIATVLGVSSSVPESAATGKGAVEKLEGKTNINY